ncbi:MAG: chromate transporter [Clostridia bacterium]|nr:chromate transporter [Clostridia bacterium]
MIYWELFYTFFTIGLFTVGGGYAMLPLIQERVVANEWMPSEQIMNFIAVSESTPGPFAINIATYVGMEEASVLGAVCATLGVVLPSFIIILLVAQAYERFKTSRLVAGAMTGLRPVVVGLIGSAIYSMIMDVFFSAGISLEVVLSFWFIVSAAIFVVMLILVFKKVHPIIVILLSAGVGIAAGYLEPTIMGWIR